MSGPPPLGVLEWHHVMLSLQLANLDVDQEGPSKKNTHHSYSKFCSGYASVWHCYHSNDLDLGPLISLVSDRSDDSG